LFGTRIFSCPAFPREHFTPWTPELILQYSPCGAAGLDGWTGEHLQTLDPLALEGLALLLDEANRSNVPTFWYEARTVGIPKEDSHEKRPLTILSSFYRIWARRHARSISDWIDAYLPQGAYGARPGRSAADCSWRLQCAIDSHRRRRQPAYVLFLDQRQCFDRLSISQIRKPCQRPNCPPELFKARDTYARLRRTIMIDGAPMGHILDGPNIDGIPQGCPIAAMLCTLVSAAWEESLRMQLQTGLFLSYLDDRAILCHSVSDLNTAIRLTKAFDDCLAALSMTPNVSGAAQLLVCQLLMVSFFVFHRHLPSSTWELIFACEAQQRVPTAKPIGSATSGRYFAAHLLPRYRPLRGGHLSQTP